MLEPSPEMVRASDRPGAVLWAYGIFLSLILPIVLAVVLFQIEPLNPVHLPMSELTQQNMKAVPRVNNRVLQEAEFIGVGELVAPEDIAFDSKAGIIYTGCGDGWIKRVNLNNSVVENWVNTGGRPLGLALGLNNELIVADPFKGLLNVSAQGKVELLTDEAEGQKLIFVDGVDVAKDGMIYFSEASYKYGLPDFIWDILEGKPHGSLMSFNPTTRETKVLARHLYFANGVQVSVDQKYVIFCETVMRRCKRYIREGERIGFVEMFVDNLPGLPDNIRYDGEGHYWIALGSSSKPYWDLALRYPFIRKGLAILTRYVGQQPMEKNAGLIATDLEGNPVAHYFDPSLALISGGNKIGQQLYFGSLIYPYVIRLNLTQPDV